MGWFKSSEEEQLYEILRSLRKKYLPGPKEAIRLGILKILGDRATPEYVRDNFSDLVVSLESDLHDVYREAEREAMQKVLKYGVFANVPADEGREELEEYLLDNVHALDSLALSFAQGRKSRAGDALETICEALFSIMKIPFTAQPKSLDGIPDFIIPSEKYYLERPTEAIVFTVKRLLRERWRQVVTEGTRGHRQFLATIDPDLTGSMLEEAKVNRIYVVVPRSLRDSIYSYSTVVISFEEFIRRFIDRSVGDWD